MKATRKARKPVADPRVSAATAARAAVRGYIAALRGPRASASAIRGIIQALAPAAVDHFSYRIPASSSRDSR